MDRQVQGSPGVIVGIPVWNGAGFVAEAIDCVMAQTYPKFTVVLSVDGADTASAAACEPYLAHDRVRMIMQPRRLGWVLNTAALYRVAAGSDAAYACIQPHDDLIEPDYLAALVDAHRSHQRAAVTYCDIQAFGMARNTFAQPTLAGPPMQRMLTGLRDHYAAVAYRGLVPTDLLRRVALISGNPYWDFAADTIWIARLATQGDLIRVPDVLYRKRYHGDNMHLRWNQWNAAQKIAAWSDHCLRMLTEAVAVAGSFQDRQRLVRQARARFLQEEVAISPFTEALRSMRPTTRRRRLDEFDQAAAKIVG